MPKWLRKWVWDGGDRYFLDPKLGPPINGLRAKLGLAEPATSIMGEWWHSPDRIIGLWPDWYGPRQPDWPERLRTVGFPLFDEEGITPLSDELDAWLRAGEAPIAFTPGSAMIQGAGFFVESTKACVQLNRRGLLLTRHADQIPRDLPALVKHVDYAPFGALLPRCAALVHHGGIGTTAQTLRAGIPQLIMPMSHDQFDNAARVRKLGVGDEIRQDRYRSAAVAARLQPLLNDPKVRETCRQISARFAGQDALNRAAELIEALPEARIGAPALTSTR
jgi:UDP:flavonoid glycosyltransferase YjiC (YdhE family)